MKAVAAIFGGLFLLFMSAVAVVGAWGVGNYNVFVSKQEQVSESWSQVENVYQRRFDLIPNIVETVKGVAGFEKSTLVEVAKARASVGQFKIDNSVVNDPQQFAKFQQAQGTLGSALMRLMVVSERYPDLRSTEAFQDLRVELEGTENRIAVERMTFNKTAMDYNQSIKQFPASLVANFGGFRQKAYFQMDEGAKAAPKVKF